MDQQWNATNFFFWVPRSEISNERKRCTNRISFFIDERHGSRIFPNNIVSQISLLLYRDKRLLDTTTPPRVFASALKKVGALLVILVILVIPVLLLDSLLPFIFI
jgi:hypothetical protein